MCTASSTPCRVVIVVPGIEVLPDVQVDQADARAERREHALPLDQRLRARDVGLGHVVLGARAVDVGGRGALALSAPAPCASASIRRAGASASSAAARPASTATSSSTSTAPRPRRPGQCCSSTLVHGAGQLVAQRDRLQRLHRADRGRRARVLRGARSALDHLSGVRAARPQPRRPRCWLRLPEVEAEPRPPTAPARQCGSDQLEGAERRRGRHLGLVIDRSV
jgi:hypothetical protein